VSCVVSCVRACVVCVVCQCVVLVGRVLGARGRILPLCRGRPGARTRTRRSSATSRLGTPTHTPHTTHHTHTHTHNRGATGMTSAKHVNHAKARGTVVEQ
jgi:hypothetical protein